MDEKTILKWIREERIYPFSLFHYVVIIFMTCCVGLFTFGFEISNATQGINLFINFIWLLLLIIFLLFTEFWYKLIFQRKSILPKRREEFERRLKEIKDPHKRYWIQSYLDHKGALPQRNPSKWSFIFLGCCVLFELFFVSAWVKQQALVWKPTWIEAILAFVKANTNVPPLNIDRKFFILDLDSIDLANQFANEPLFLSSNMGEVCMLFQFWRAISFIPILIALMVIFWKMMKLKKVNPYYIDSPFRFLFCCFISLFMILFLLGVPFGMMCSIDFIYPMGLSNVMWFESFSTNTGFILLLVSIRILTGWFYFWKRILFAKQTSC